MTFTKTVGAYLVGWVIAQTIFSRVMKFTSREQRGKDWERFHATLAAKVAPLLADELDRMRTGEGYGVSSEGVARIAGYIASELEGEQSGLTSQQLAAACRAAFERLLAEARNQSSAVGAR